MKEELIQEAAEGYAKLEAFVEEVGCEILKQDFPPLAATKKCCTFEQGNNMRDLLVHAYEWQRLQSAFVANIRNGEPKDFIPEPYRKDYKAMDRANWEKHQSTSLEEALRLLAESHREMISLMDGFTEEELFGKKVFKVTYTTTMAAYFKSVTVSPYSQIVKRAKCMKPKKKK